MMMGMMVTIVGGPQDGQTLDVPDGTSIINFSQHKGSVREGSLEIITVERRVWRHPSGQRFVFWDDDHPPGSGELYEADQP
jgi:hypothetical protein